MRGNHKRSHGNYAHPNSPPLAPVGILSDRIGDASPQWVDMGH